MNELLNKCNNKKDFPSYFTINGDKIDNKEDIANHFNPFFQKYWKQYLKSSIALTQNTAVVMMIYQLYLWKKLPSHIITNYFNLTLNQSLFTGIFPDRFKITKIIPLIKKKTLINFIIIDQYHSCQHSPKYLKRLSLYNCLITSTKIIFFTIANMDFALCIQQN